ncbi:ATP-dependent zinc metalloprotease FtsH [Paraburkholderia kururiensis]|uniref:ATP-dependent zinc metalloprotease FtsH n=1 Tax=Paraburkholderia kururiensis TaxID=984307 RepID=UPI000A91184B|nr:ATP-dependent zinc metalloprotease FtsH [Paraburkholderia kururiensis]
MRNHTLRAGLAAAAFAAWAYGAPVLAQPIPVSGASTASLADLTTAYQNGADEPAVGATGDSAKVRTLAYSEFVALVEKGGIRSVRIEGSTLSGKLGNGGSFRTVAPADPALIDRLLSHQVRIEAAANNGMGFLDSPLFQTLLIGVLMVGAILFTSRQGTQGSGSNKAASFGRSRARLISPDAHRTTFADVAGIEEAAVELDEIVRYLREPSAFLRLGGRVPKGVLLIGPPGTGKTLLARAVAGEAGVPFFSISGAEFVEMFVGVGAARVRDLFREARQHAPCIVFIDEIDAVGRHRSSGAGGNDEREQTVNQLLVEMDGFSGSESVIVLAATNRPDVLDAALLRPGRFDRQVMVPAPDTAGRQKILEVHMRPVPVATDVDSAVIARGTPGFAGADLANLVNEAALIAVRRGHARVSMADFDEARDKVLLGPERRSLAVTAREREMTAYHEAGHALVALRSPYQDPLHKVTIVPRGRAFGVTLSLPERDQHSFSKRQLEGRLAMMFGGRVAEELVYGREEVTTGASDDIRQATQLARRMVTEFGFSDTVGVVCCESGVDPHGMPVAMSAAMAATIDSEVRRITGEAEADARRILVAERAALERIAEALLARETLTGEEIDALLDGSREPQRETPEAEHAELEHAEAA